MLVVPKKKLGQHFLHDKNIAQKIFSSIPHNPSKIIEIGPGMGILTKLLTQQYENFLAIEIDSQSVNYLIENQILASHQLLHDDFLSIELQKILVPNSCLIGNLPYNISSQIFFRILEHRQLITSVVCMIQHEVAERLSAMPGTKMYGILSVLLQAYYRIEYLFKVKPSVFYPPPKVDSAVIRLTRNNTINLPCHEELFFQIVKVAFNQRRKMLRNSLKNYYHNEQLQQPIFMSRPEQLSIDDFIRLTQMVKLF